MIKFRKYIYYNEQMVNDFINQIPEMTLELKQKEKSKNSSINGAGGVIVAKIESEISENETSKFNIRTNELEQFITWCEDKNNSIDINEKIPTNLNIGNICIISGKAYLPEKVQEFELLESFKDNFGLLATLPGIDSSGMEMIQLLKNSNSIPLFIDLNDNIVSYSIIKKNLKEEISDFFESIEEDIVVVGRIDNIYSSGNIEVFDIAKEVLKINRTVRRNMTSEQLKDVIIYEYAPLIKITPLIIYK